MTSRHAHRDRAGPERGCRRPPQGNALLRVRQRHQMCVRGRASTNTIISFLAKTEAQRSMMASARARLGTSFFARIAFLSFAGNVTPPGTATISEILSNGVTLSLNSPGATSANILAHRLGVCHQGSSRPCKHRGRNVIDYDERLQRNSPRSNRGCRSARPDCRLRWASCLRATSSPEGCLIKTLL